MNKEDYVSFEVAKLLKEKGFNEYCSTNYFTRDENAFNYKEGDMCIGDHTINGECITIPAPTLWNAQKWLREKYDINVIPKFDTEEETDVRLGYSFDIYNGNKFVTFRMGYDTYEQALNAGILEALKLI